MQGYHNNVTATENALEDNWLKTGDVGYHDDEGNIFLVDRIKDLVRVTTKYVLICFQFTQI